MTLVKIQKDGASGPLARCIAKMSATDQPTPVQIKKEDVLSEKASSAAGSSSTDSLGTTATKGAEDYDDPAPASDWVKTWIATNKKDYNAFAYRLKESADKMEWKRIQKEGTAGEARQFVEMVKASGVRTSKVRAVAEIDTVDDENTWMSWKEASDKEGEAQLRAMVSANTVESRRHPKIPENADIQWPFYLQIKINVEKTCKRKKTTEEDKEDTTTEMADFENRWCQRALPRSSSTTTAPEAQKEKEKEKDEKDEATKAALAEVRKMHGVWDRFCRDAQGTIMASTQCENTNGCKIQIDLEQELKVGATVDKTILAFETACATIKKADPEDITNVAAQCHALDSILKSGRKKAVALKGLFKL